MAANGNHLQLKFSLEDGIGQFDLKIIEILNSSFNFSRKLFFTKFGFSRSFVTRFDRFSQFI